MKISFIIVVMALSTLGGNSFASEIKCGAIDKYAVGNGTGYRWAKAMTLHQIVPTNEETDKIISNAPGSAQVCVQGTTFTNGFNSDFFTFKAWIQNN